MFPARWSGTIFTVQYSNDTTQKTPIRVYVLTSSDTFQIISMDWKTALETIRASEIDRVDGKKTVTSLTLKLAKFTTMVLNSAPDPCDQLVEALTPCAPAGEPEPSLLSATTIMPSMRSAAPQIVGVVTDISRQLLQFFDAGDIVSPALMDALICTHRARFQNEAVVGAKLGFETIAFDLKHTLIVRWAKAADHFQFSEKGSTAVNFQTKIATAIANMIRKVGVSLSMPVHSLEHAIASQSFPTGIEMPIRRLGKEAQDNLDRDELPCRPVDRDGCLVLRAASLAVIAGVVAGMYEIDLNAYRQAIVEFTQSIGDRGGMRQATQTFQARQNIYLRDLLCLLDGKRFDDVFQWIYCLWDLKTGA
jgi:hypothetical protein